MKNQTSRKFGVLAMLFAASLWGCDQLAVTGLDSLESTGASFSKGGKGGNGGGPGGGPPASDDGGEDDTQSDYGLAWPT